MLLLKGVFQTKIAFNWQVFVTFLLPTIVGRFESKIKLVLVNKECLLFQYIIVYLILTTLCTTY
jgi:hypothetical protein